MKDVKLILERLKNPIVLISIGSQVLIIASIFKKIDANMITNLSIAISSILVSLGVINNPAKEKVKTEELTCEHCNKNSTHALINGKYLCTECGCEFHGQCPIDLAQRKFFK